MRRLNLRWIGVMAALGAIFGISDSAWAQRGGRGGGGGFGGGRGASMGRSFSGGGGGRSFSGGGRSFSGGGNHLFSGGSGRSFSSGSSPMFSGGRSVGPSISRGGSFNPGRSGLGSFGGSGIRSSGVGQQNFSNLGFGGNRGPSPRSGSVFTAPGAMNSAPRSIPGRNMGTVTPRSQAPSNPSFGGNLGGSGVGQNRGGFGLGQNRGGSGVGQGFSGVGSGRNPGANGLGSQLGRNFGANNANNGPRNFGNNFNNNGGVGRGFNGASGFNNNNNNGINNRGFGQGFNGNRGNNFNGAGNNNRGLGNNNNRGFGNDNNRGIGWNNGRGGWGRGPGNAWGHHNHWHGGPWNRGWCGPSRFYNNWCGPWYRPSWGWGAGLYIGGAITYWDTTPVVYGYPVTYIDDVTYVDPGYVVEPTYVETYPEYTNVAPPVVQQPLADDQLMEIPAQPQTQPGVAPMTAEPMEQQTQPQSTAPQNAPQQDGSNQQMSPSEIALATGDQSFNTGNYQEARKHYAQAILKEQNDPRGHIAMGLTLAALGDYSEAGRALRNGVTLAPALAGSGFDLSQAYGKREDMLRHIAGVNDYLRKNPDDMNALFVAGFMQIFGGDPVNGKAAFESYKSRPEADPKMATFIDAAIKSVK